MSQIWKLWADYVRWAAPLKAGVHSEQRFHYMAAKGEVRVDQAHRGYSVVEDDVGKLDVRPPVRSLYSRQIDC